MAQRYRMPNFLSLDIFFWERADTDVCDKIKFVGFVSWGPIELNFSSSCIKNIVKINSKLTAMNVFPSWTLFLRYLLGVVQNRTQSALSLCRLLRRCCSANPATLKFLLLVDPVAGTHTTFPAALHKKLNSSSWFLFQSNKLLKST
jgi:hypothetical protein